MDKGCGGDCPGIEVDDLIQSPANTNIDAIVVVMESLRNGECNDGGTARYNAALAHLDAMPLELKSKQANAIKAWLVYISAEYGWSFDEDSQ